MSLHLEVRIGNSPLMDACPRRFSDVYGQKKCIYKKCGVLAGRSLI